MLTLVISGLHKITTCVVVSPSLGTSYNSWRYTVMFSYPNLPTSWPI